MHTIGIVACGGTVYEYLQVRATCTKWEDVYKLVAVEFGIPRAQFHLQHAEGEIIIPSAKFGPDANNKYPDIFLIQF